MAVDLRFVSPLPASTALRFGASAADGQTIRFDATLPPPTGTVSIQPPALPVSFAAALPPPSGTVSIEYDLNMPVYVGTSAAAVWRDASAVRPHAPRLPWADGLPRRPTPVALPWRDALALRPPAPALPWRDATRFWARAALPWQPATPVRPVPAALPWRDGALLRPVPAALAWRDAVEARRSVSGGWRDGVPLRLAQGMPWRDGARSQHQHILAWREGRLLPAQVGLTWRDGALIETHGGSPFAVVVKPPYDPCYTVPLPGTPIALRFRMRQDGSAALLFVCDNHPPAVASVVVPIRKVYVVINNTHLIKLDGMVELKTLGMQLTLDAEAWTWGFSASLPADQRSLVTPALSGAPVMVAAVVNGVSYHMLVEGIQRDRRFNQDAIRITGRGKNAVLSAPYARTQSFGNAAARTAAQLLDDALSVNGVGIGWTVDSALTDWLVPAGAWSHVGSHITAALSVANAAGGYLQPHATSDTLRVMARYPSAPWEWGSVTPDLELPASVVEQEGITWVEKPRYNRVFVSGTGQGVLCQVTRAGTAGDIVAPMVADPLITQAAAGRQRGLSVLADTGRVAMVSLGLPVLPETGVITPGSFVRYVDGSTTRLGLVRSTAVNVAQPSVWQTIEVETHE